MTICKWVLSLMKKKNCKHFYYLTNFTVKRIESKNRRAGKLASVLTNRIQCMRRKRGIKLVHNFQIDKRLFFPFTATNQCVSTNFNIVTNSFDTFFFRLLKDV